MTKCLKCGENTFTKSNKFCGECILDIEFNRVLGVLEDE